MNFNKVAVILDQAVEVSYAQITKESSVQPMDLYRSGLGFASTGLLVLNLPWAFAGLWVVETVLIALGLITRAEIKKRFGANPTDRGKNGSKRHFLVDGRGVPLLLVVNGANGHDVTQLKAVLDFMVVKRISPPQRHHKHLCADVSYTGAPAMKVIEKHSYIAHVIGRGKVAAELIRDPEKKLGVVSLRWQTAVSTAFVNC